MCAGPVQRQVHAGRCCPAGTLTARRAAVFSLSTAAVEATGITLSQRRTACLSAAASVSPAWGSVSLAQLPVVLSTTPHFFYSPGLSQLSTSRKTSFRSFSLAVPLLCLTFSSHSPCVCVFVRQVNKYVCTKKWLYFSRTSFKNTCLTACTLTLAFTFTPTDVSEQVGSFWCATPSVLCGCTCALKHFYFPIHLTLEQVELSFVVKAVKSWTCLFYFSRQRWSEVPTPKSSSNWLDTQGSFSWTVCSIN